MFSDKVKIKIRSGKGGDGHVSFRRELYVPNGGPDGGDGGKGGDVIFVVDDGLNTLSDYRYHRTYKAEDGQEGGKRRCAGRKGNDLVLKVPQGTVIREASSRKIICDMSGENKRVIVLQGGSGGIGNMHFATSTMQAPKYAKPGKPATELEIILELKMIADVGLVGFPNVGKSTLLSRITNARPKIANYHFTTLSPNLGVVDYYDGNGFVIADIPGLIEGAADGAGLGHEFLRHIDRTKVLLHVVDVAGTEGRDPIQDIYAIMNELSLYEPNILQKPQAIAANKIDCFMEDSNERLEKLKAEFEPKGLTIYPISAATGEGITELIDGLAHLLSHLDEATIVYAQEFFPEDMIIAEELPYTVEADPKAEGRYIVEGPKIEKMLGYTNLESEKGFLFFQEFMRKQGILKQLEDLGIQDGDTVKIYGFEFDYYR